jgi:hypothetical protein
MEPMVTIGSVSTEAEAEAEAEAIAPTCGGAVSALLVQLSVTIALE